MGDTHERLKSLHQRYSWDQVWMEIAQTISYRTTCTFFRVGCVLVSNNNKHLVMGYNGSPSGAPNCHEADCPKEDGGRCRGCHAEINAIINCHGAPNTFKNGTAYVTVFPCNDCAKALSQAGIVRVVFKDEYLRLSCGNGEVVHEKGHDGMTIFMENNVKVESWDNVGKVAVPIMERTWISEELP